METLLLESKRVARVKKGRTIQHLAGAVILMLAAWDHIDHGGLSLLSVLEIAAGAWLVGSVIVERRRKHEHGGVAWVELAGAGMMFVEAIAKLEQRHHVSFYIISFIPPLLFLAFALFDARITKMRRLGSDEDSFLMQMRLFRPRRVAWSEVASWTRSSDAIEVTRRDGKKMRFSFRDVVNADQAMQWAEAQFAQRGSLPAIEVPGRQSDSGKRHNDEPLELADHRAD